MAITRLTDIVPVKVFTDVVEAKLTENSKFRTSGVIGVDPRVTAKAQTAGLEVTLREWKRPAGGEATSASDDDTQKLSASKVEQRAMLARIISRAKAFSAMDIADFASDSAAIEFAAAEFARLRLADEESAILSILSGILADNAANDSSDMIKAYHLTTGTITAANKFSADTLLGGRTTMGDAGGELNTLVMHSDVVNYLRSQEPNAFVPASQTSLGLDRYMGYNIIETDNVGKAGTVNYPIYTTYMVGAGVLAYGASPVANGLVQVRDELAGNGSGSETIINRFRYLLHPAGFSNIAAASNGVSQTNAELSAAVTWDRVADRKAIPLVAIKTN